MFIKKSSPTPVEPEVSRNLLKCSCCGKPVMAKMVKQSSDKEIEPELLCFECKKRNADSESQ